MTGSATNHLTNRRGFLEIAAAGTAAALSRPLPAGAAEKTITILHESSFIKTVRRIYRRTRWPRPTRRRPASRSITKLTSVGSLPTRVSTIAETGYGADITMNGLLQAVPVQQEIFDVSDIAEEVGKAARRLVRRRQGGRVVNGKWKAIPFGNIGQLMNWRTDWFKEVGVQEVPGHLGRAL